MPANIRYTITRGLTTLGPFDNVSTDVALKGDVVHLECPDLGQSSYEWSLAFIPKSSNGTLSSAVIAYVPATNNRLATFTIDFDGPYLVGLLINEGIPLQEDSRWVRIRAITSFGEMPLSAAGERSNLDGSVPYDGSSKGWSYEANETLQRLVALSRRNATTGRVLYVDANRPRGYKETSNPASDPSESVSFPGTDQTSLTTNTQTGISVATRSFGDFGTIQEAIDYALNAVARGEEAPSANNPFWVLINPGLYTEALVLHENIHLLANDAGAFSIILPAAMFGYNIPSLEPNFESLPVRVIPPAGEYHVWNAPDQPKPDDIAPFLADLPLLVLKGISFITREDTVNPVISMTGAGYLLADNCVFTQLGTSLTQGPVISMTNPNYGATTDQINSVTFFVTHCIFYKKPVAGHVFNLDSRCNLTILESFVMGVDCFYVPETANAGAGVPKGSNITLDISESNLVAFNDIFSGIPSRLRIRNCSAIGNLNFITSSVSNITHNLGVVLHSSEIDGFLYTDDGKFDSGYGVTIDPVGVSKLTIRMLSAPTKCATILPTASVTSYKYDEAHVVPERGLLGLATIVNAKQRIQTPENTNLSSRSQNVLDILTQLAVPEAPPSVGDAEYVASRTYTPTLNAAYNGIHHMDLNPVVGQGLGRKIRIRNDSSGGPLNGQDLPVQFMPDTAVPTRHLVRVGWGNPGDPDQCYTDLGCESHGVLKIYGSIDAGIQTPVSHQSLTAVAGVLDLSALVSDAKTMVIGVTSDGVNATTLTLPHSPGMSDGQILIIKDEEGAAFTRNIVLTRPVVGGGHTVVIEAADTTLTMSDNLSSISLYFKVDTVGTTDHWFVF